MNSLFLQLKTLVENKVSLFWQIENFKHYIQEDINPLGLRVQIFPTLDNLDTTFKKRWENNLQQCTKTMMRLLIEEYRKRTAALEKEFEEVYTKLEPFKDVSTYREQEEHIKGHIDLVVKELITNKEQNF